MSQLRAFATRVRHAPVLAGLDPLVAAAAHRKQPGVQLMVEGERTRFWIPQELAYKGEAGQPAGMLVFDIELIRFE